MNSHTPEEQALLIVWKQDYSVNHAVIDKQHRYIVDLINKLYQFINWQNENKNIADIKNELIRYTRVHFNLEERLMQQGAFLGFEDHRELHDQMRHKVDHWKLKRTKDSHEELRELLDYLKSWWLNHILIEDRKYIGSLD